METRITKPGNVLAPDGTPHPGYSTEELLRYDRRMIKANPFRIKEWDFYQIEDLDGKLCLQLTYGHAAYIGQIGVMLFDIETREWLYNHSVLVPLALDRMRLPKSAEKAYEVRWEKGDTKVLLQKGDDPVRHISFALKGFSAELTLTPQLREKLIINIPFDESPQQFYYNYKQNGMACTGRAVFQQADGTERTLLFGNDTAKGEIPALAILDWGRGVWPFHNEWFWSNGHGYIEDQLFAFNLGCGFGNTEKATENIFFYQNEAHKLGPVEISHEEDFMKPWTLRDREGRCELRMEPAHDRITRDKILFVDNCTHQVFGRFYGKVVTNGGITLKIDGLPAFAEHAVNNW